MDAEEFAREAVPLYAHLARVAYLLSGDRHLGEESAQEALVRAWQRVDRGSGLDSLAAWTTTVALNHCRSQMRRRKAEARAMARLPIPTVYQDVVTARPSDEVRVAILALSLRQREVVVLHYFADLALKSIAEVLGISVGAVKNALFNARQSLARTLRAPDSDPEASVITTAPRSRSTAHGDHDEKESQ